MSDREIQVWRGKFLFATSTFGPGFDMVIDCGQCGHATSVPFPIFACEDWECFFCQEPYRSVVVLYQSAKKTEMPSAPLPMCPKAQNCGRPA